MRLLKATVCSTSRSLRVVSPAEVAAHLEVGRGRSGEVVTQGANDLDVGGETRSLVLKERIPVSEIDTVEIRFDRDSATEKPQPDDNGFIDDLGYERGRIDTSLPFEELRRRANITERAKAADQASDFSTRIRTHFVGS